MSRPAETAGARVAALLRRYRYTYADEAGLQAGAARVLEQNGVNAVLEARLATGGRIDLLLPGERVGIEVKVAGSASDVARQLRGYLASPELDEVVLLTDRASHAAVVLPGVSFVLVAW